MNKPTVIFFGNEQLTQGLSSVITPSFDALLQNNYDIIALVLAKKPETKKSRSAKIPEIIEKAVARDIPVFFPANSAELLSLVESLNPDIGVLASFGRLVPERVINSFPLGILNIHPSLLPKYRGTTPIESAILNGDQKTGVSIMELAKEMDAGAIYAQKSIQLSGRESKQDLYETLARLGSSLLIKTLEEIVSGVAKPIAQNESAATFTQKLDKSRSPLDPAAKSATQLYREVRAFLNFPKSKYLFFGIDCAITRASVAMKPENPDLDLKTADGSYLVIEKLIPAGKKEMSAADFLHGFQNRQNQP
jgi:methionyl-tRNA formyltransferase